MHKQISKLILIAIIVFFNSCSQENLKKITTELEIFITDQKFNSQKSALRFHLKSMRSYSNISDIVYINAIISNSFKYLELNKDEENHLKNMIRDKNFYYLYKSYLKKFAEDNNITVNNNNENNNNSKKLLSGYIRKTLGYDLPECLKQIILKYRYSYNKLFYEILNQTSDKSKFLKLPISEKIHTLKLIKYLLNEDYIQSFNYHTDNRIGGIAKIVKIEFFDSIEFVKLFEQSYEGSVWSIYLKLFDKKSFSF